MIKLMDLLVEEYRSCYRIYISWTRQRGAVYRSIHNIPLIELAPLPVSVQLLNVIKAVLAAWQNRSYTTVTTNL
jgi:hypothetical protein